MPNASIPAAAGPFAESWAEVRARGHVVRYRRSGTGRTVILFAPSEGPGATPPELLDALGAGFRLLVPEPPPTDDDTACWLSAFLEGLGIPDVRLLAGGRLCAPVLRLALVEGDQIAGVVLVTAVDDAAIEDAARRLAIPVLLVDESRPVEEIVPLVTEFLRGG